MAARGIVDELQDVVEKLGKIQNDQLGPLADEMVYTHGPEQVETFKSSVDTAIAGLLDSARSTKDAVNNAALVLSWKHQQVIWNQQQQKLAVTCKTIWKMISGRP